VQEAIDRVLEVIATHLSTFYELVKTMGFEENDFESIYLRLFPFLLTGKAKEWLNSHPNPSLSSWNDYIDSSHSLDISRLSLISSHSSKGQMNLFVKLANVLK